MDALASKQRAEETQRSRKAHAETLGLTLEKYNDLEEEVVRENPGIGPLKKMVKMNNRAKTLKGEGNGGKRRRTRKRKAKLARRRKHRR